MSLHTAQELTSLGASSALHKVLISNGVLWLAPVCGSPRGSRGAVRPPQHGGAGRGRKWLERGQLPASRRVAGSKLVPASRRWGPGSRVCETEGSR